MKIKVTTTASTVLLVLVVTAAPALGGLLRTPKVYNAVITTDENLTPSRAYPVVQPVVHETGLAYPFGAFGPFGLYNAFNAYPGFYQQQPQPQFQPQGVAPEGLRAAGNGALPAGFAQLQGRNAFFAGREQAPQLQETPIETLPGAKPHPETNLPLREAPAPELIPIPNNSIAPKAPEGPRPNYEVNRPEAVDPKNQLQLNEFGLPPSLIPLYQPGAPNQPSYNFAGNPNQQQGYNFPSGYPYNFPVLYDSFGNYNPNQQYQSVLPPFGYYPQLAQPNPYFGQNVPQAGPADNRNGREQDLQENGKENLQDATESAPEVAPEAASAETIEEPSKVEPEADKQDAQAPPAPAVLPIPDSIKNNANKNKNIPDVPPPPIPSGAKEADQQ